MRTLELWYEAMGADELVANIKDPALRHRALKRLQKERGRSISEDIFPKLVERNGDIPFIKDELPTIFQVGGHHYFVRQLRDIKIGIRVETFGASEMALYATWCGRALALAHARSGHSIILSGYMGKSDAFDRALSEFSVAYADQNERDHAALEKAVRTGKVKAVFEEPR